MKASGMSLDQSTWKRIRFPPIAATWAISARCCSGVVVKGDPSTDQLGVTIAPRSWRDPTRSGEGAWRFLAEAGDAATGKRTQSTIAAASARRIHANPVHSLQHWLAETG